MEETTKKKRTRKKKTETPAVSTEAMRAAAGIYGKGKIMQHRLIMNFGKAKAAEIMKEVETINNMVV